MVVGIVSEVRSEMLVVQLILAGDPRNSILSFITSFIIL